MNRLHLALLLFLISFSVQGEEIKIAQSGPGITGALAPLTSDTPLALRNESVTIDFFDSEAVIKAQYYIYNPTSESVNELVGIPTLSFSDSPLPLLDLRITVNSQPVTPVDVFDEWDVDYDLSPYIPFIQKFNLKRKWTSFNITAAPRSEIYVDVFYKTPYLSKEEDLEGRNEYSPRLFQYRRNLTGRWAETIYSSQINQIAKISQPVHFSISPKPIPVEGVLGRVDFSKKPASDLTNIVAVYDPLFFKVTDFALGGKPPPTEKVEDGAANLYDHLFDDSLSTRWCEGDLGWAQNDSFEIEWGKHRLLTEIKIFPGYSDIKSEFESRNRLRAVKLYLTKPGWTSEPIPVTFDDKPEWKIIPIRTEVSATMLVVEILDVYKGPRNDTCIAEIGLKLTTP